MIGWRTEGRADRVTVVGAGVAGCVLAGAVVTAPVVGVLCVAAAVFLIDVRCPKVGAALATCLIVATPTLAGVSGVNQIGYLDDFAVWALAIGVLLRRLAPGRRFGRLVGGWWYLGFFVVGASASLLNEIPTGVWVQGGILAAKGVAFGWAVAQCDWNRGDVQRLITAGAVLAGVVVIGVALNVVAGTTWTQMFQGYVDSRFGGTAYVGFFRHPLTLGNIGALLASAAVAWLSVFGRGRGAILTIVASVVAALASLRRTALAGMLAGALMVMVAAGRTRMVVAVLGGVAAAVVAAWSYLVEVFDSTYSEYVVEGDLAARNLLTFGAGDVADHYFPFGAGFGRFGSATAAQNYSPEYVRLGFDSVWGLRADQDSGQFLTDTAWPAILGEGGWIGCALFAAGLVAAFRMFWRARSSSTPEVRWLGLVGMAWMTSIVLSSFAVPVFSGPPFFALLFGLIGFSARLVDLDRRVTREPARSG